jgi:phosphoenolpyruvate synthase/pyruvate phosphate dikinase
MFNSERLNPYIPDGCIIPFGFFKKYAQQIGIDQHLKTLSQINLKNRALALDLARQIQVHISRNPIPPEMLAEIENSLAKLQQRINTTGGFFFRSDTNIEDLPHFNGAGLNKTIPNVKLQSKIMDEAIRKVWVSPFTEKSIYWRAKALPNPTVTLAEPSVVVMPTVQALSSGVILSRGGPNWELKKGALSANWGIGSVVEAAHAVEEISFESKTPHRFSFSVSLSKPEADSEGGIVLKRIESGRPVLSENETKQLNKVAKIVEEVLGGQPHGWDIEWAFDEHRKLKILQARPNM